MDFEQLYRDCFTTVYRACLVKFKQDEFAMEITQEAFTRALMKLGDLRDESKFLSWVTAIAINYGYHKARLDQDRFNQLPPDDLLDQALLFAAPDSPEADDAGFIRGWIATLNESDRLLFLMKHYYYMTNNDISKETGIPLSTLKRRLSLLMNELKDAFEKEMSGGR